MPKEENIHELLFHVLRSLANYDVGDEHPDLYFEIKRHGEETHRGTFKIVKSITTYPNKFTFFAEACCHPEDAYPYQTCLGQVIFPKFSTNSFLKMRKEIEKIIVKDKLFDSIVLFGLSNGQMGFGPFAHEIAAERALSHQFHVVPWVDLQSGKKLPEKGQFNWKEGLMNKMRLIFTISK